MDLIIYIVFFSAGFENHLQIIPYIQQRTSEG